MASSVEIKILAGLVQFIVQVAKWAVFSRQMGCFQCLVVVILLTYMYRG